jgi:hypothetical protein
MSSLISTFHDAAVSPEAWPHALKALTDAAGVADAALIVLNRARGTWIRSAFRTLAVKSKPTTSATTPLWTRFAFAGRRPEEAPRVSSGFAVTDEQVVQRFRVNVRRPRDS